MENVYENLRVQEEELHAMQGQSTSHVNAGQTQYSEIVIKDILEKMWNELQKPENQQRIQKFRDESGNDMITIMKSLFPFVVQVQVDVLEDYLAINRNNPVNQQLQMQCGFDKLQGCAEKTDDLKEFLIHVNHFIPENQEIFDLLMNIKHIYLPSFVSSSL